MMLGILIFLLYIFLCTFMHLADAFIQSEKR